MTYQSILNPFMKVSDAFVLLLLCFALIIPAHAQTPYDTLIRGKLDRVVDGDTIRIEGYKQAFRLYGIDATELKQSCTRREGEQEIDIAYGEMATEFLKKEILHDYLDTIITCEFNKTGRYNRPLATCFARNDIYSDINLNKLMVFRGRAFADHKYAKDEAYIALEDIARKNQWGMWHGSIKCESPAEFRKSKKK